MLQGPNKLKLTPTAIKSMSGWYWPASIQQSETAERKLLAGVELQYANSHVTVDDKVISFVHCVFNNNGHKKIPVVMAHGLGAGLAFFYKNLTPLIKDGWPVYAFDWLGMGRSGRPPFPCYPKNNVETIIDFFIKSFEEWRISMHLEKFVLIGHSLGGYLSALYALKHPNRVETLILSSPVGLPVNKLEESESKRVLSITGHEVPGWLVNLWNRNFTPQFIVRTLGPIGPRLTTAYINARFQYLPEEEQKALSDYLYQITADLGSGEYALAGILVPGAWAREPLHDRLSCLSMPCHFIYGDTDWMDYKHAEEAAKRMTVRTSIFRVSNSGHHLYIDNPDEYNRLILTLLNDRERNK